MGSIAPTQPPWWKDAVVYQVYPASFKDSNGDGIGDIPGVISKLDYLKDLGVDVMWLSPMFKSPQVDMGYDISDYEDVHAPFGNLADMDELIEGLHSRGMRLILDLVVNHTSDQHSWFQESRSSKTNPKRDWYIWRPPRYDAAGNRHPPNNWRANFGGSIWEWDENTQEYYLHYYAVEQPDLNWDNEDTRKAIYDSAIRFWLDKGVDGFRVDTVNKYSKPAEFVDAPINDPSSPWQYAYPLFCNGPRIHEYIKEMVREAVKPYGDMMLVGELPATPDPKEILRYTSAREKELDMVFHFDMVYTGMGTVRKYIPSSFDLRDVKAAIARWQTFIQGTDMWTTAFAENHDSARSISRFASDLPQYREASARMLALMLTTLTGTLFIYQGQELGMVNVPRSWPVEEYKDLETANFYATMKAQTGDDPVEMSAAMDGIAYLARDHARTPMQWDSSPHAGFSTGRPWMRVHDNYPEVNAEKQIAQENSPLQFWKRLLVFRKQNRGPFCHGVFTEYGHESAAVFTYTKEMGELATSSEKEKVSALVSLNFSAEKQPIHFPPGYEPSRAELAMRTGLGKVEESVLEPYEGRVYWIR
ncbi:alpha-glucosidase [Thozetella sp. PMI_491]|nr:alpha-glucosidase [Thozetella sp. PMI_491]